MRNLHSNLENQVIKVKMSLHATRGFPLKIRQSSESKVTSRRREVTFDLLFIRQAPKEAFSSIRYDIYPGEKYLGT